MRNAYLRQIVQAAIVLLNVSLVVFVLVRIVPGDPARLMLGMEASEDAVQAARAQFGFDRPLYVQYAQFVGGALRGDRKSTRLNSSHSKQSRMPSSA